jgi:hypothetical protein
MQLRLAVELLDADRLKVRLGFRRLTTDGYISLGVISDNVGHFYELAVPLAIGVASRRMRREKEYCLKLGW